MSVYDFLNSIFGNSHGGIGRPPEFEKDGNFGYDEPHLNPDHRDDDIRVFSSMFNFMMTDPLEMHRLFEQKVDEIMKKIVSPQEFSGFQGFGLVESPDVPVIKENQDPRDHYLKPGVSTPPPSDKNRNEKSGAPTTWLDKFVPSAGQDDSSKTPHSSFSFKSVIRKSVTLPDGTIKTEEIIRNSDGSEERTESLSKPEGSNAPPFGSLFTSPDFSGFFAPPKTPEYKDPKYQFLKPGYEKFNPHSLKIDTDLDKQIEQSGIESLPAFTKEPEILKPNTFGFNFSGKSVMRRTVTLPNGVVESEEIVRNPDGTEQRTVTHLWPDGTTKGVTVPTTESLFTGKNQKTPMEGYDKSDLSFALRGIKDFIDILFK